MTLRRRLALVAAAAVAVAILLASGLVYVVVRGELRGRLDDELRQAGRAAAMARLPLLGPGGAGAAGGGGGGPPPLSRLNPPRDALGLQTTYLALVTQDGELIGPPRAAGASGAPLLPITASTRAVAAGTHGSYFTDASIDDTPVRVWTTGLLPALPGYALQVARPLTDVDRTLDRLALVLVLVSAGGIALAAVLGRLVARTALRPVAQLTDAVEHVGETGDLTRRIEVAEGEERADEIARLARSFNAMLAALEASVGRQRQLVADASHELRTPLTSLRTNIEVLALPAGLPEEERARLLTDVVGQLEELSGLVGDLVELAREQEPEQAVEDVRFDQLVAEAVQRARRRPGAPLLATELEPCLVRGVPARLDRAVANLLDNAAKWSPPGVEVTVRLHDGELTVRDRGPGIAEGDLPHVFERFYRAPAARGLPGSGLGLAIVRQVAELHGGEATAAAAPGGGALLRLALPAEPLPAQAAPGGPAQAGPPTAGPGPGPGAAPPTPPRFAAPAASPPPPPAPAASDARGAGGGTSTPAG
jgi:two-component system, OmpR family, sensor histidine kinase MprB